MYYWASFRKRGEHRIRLDTRIYLRPGEAASGDGRCIGCVIGKNPGSAVPGGSQRGPVPMELQGDRFLPNVRAIVTKAHAKAGFEPEPDAYVQVLNLFYLCDRNLSQALTKLRNSKPLPHCPTEGNTFPWAWYVWGGDDRRLNAMKDRFKGLKADTNFFFDGSRQKILSRIPERDDMARHTQGLAHEPAVTYLSTLVATARKSR